MKKRIYSIIIVALITIVFTVSSNFSIIYDQPTKNPTQPIMYLTGDDDDPYGG